MKRKGFTLIELLAVIIILGILMLIAIPSITRYIEDSRKSTYVNTANEILRGASNLVNGGELEINDEDTTYYVPSSCISTENGVSRSPFGEFESAYVVVTCNKDNYDYYWLSEDTEHIGVDIFTRGEDLSKDSIRSGVSVNTSYGVGDREKVVVFNPDCTSIKETKTATYLDDKHAVFIGGYDINEKIKSLANNGSTPYDDYNVKKFKFFNNKKTPDSEFLIDSNIVSTDDSEVPIYMWFDDTDGTIYWWSTDKRPSLGYYSGYFLSHLKELTTIENLDYFDTSEVLYFSSFFSSLDKLETLDLSGWDTSNALYMDCMFGGLNNLRYLDISSFDTSKVIDMHSMFSHEYSLESLDLSHFDTSNVTNMNSMFYCCEGYRNLDVSNFDVSNVTDMSFMFDRCERLQSLDVSSFHPYNATKMQNMFNNCELLRSITFSNFDASNVTIMTGMFHNCHTLTTLDLSSFKTSSVTSMGGRMTSSQSSRYNTGMFEDCTSLTSINLSSFDTRNVTSMCAMFENCVSLTSLDLSNFNTPSLIDMSEMFNECKKLKIIDISSFDTSNVQYFTGTFRDCTLLETIYVGNKFSRENILYTKHTFVGSSHLVGGAGTTNTLDYGNHIEYIKIDNPPDNPGLLTLKTV